MKQIDMLFFIVGNRKRFLILLCLLITSLSACQIAVEQETSQATLTLTDVSPTLTPAVIEPSATAQKSTKLTICTAALPESLFPYDGIDTRVKSNVLELILESPFERVDGQLQPVILEKVPRQADGDLRLEPIPVQAGQPVLDANGDVIVLKPGIQLRPSGCRSGACVITWDGETPIAMDQMVVVFQLKEQITWSDGTLLSASDSVFSFELATDPQNPRLDWAEVRTQSYQALNSNTIEWVGIPGFSTAAVERLIWRPMPRHLFEAGIGWEDMLSNLDAIRLPLSYGPFVLTEFDSDHLRFVPNGFYYRSAEGLPYLEEVLFQVVDGAESGWQSLQTGVCDVLDSSFNLGSQPNVLVEIQEDGRFTPLVQTGQDWAQIVFGIKPASYDDLASDGNDRPDYFGDARTRQGLAACLNREAMLTATLGNLAEIWPSFLPSSQSQLAEDEGIDYDPVQGQAWLEMVGWIDFDQNPETPRQAAGIFGVPEGTLFSVELLINESQFHQDLASIIKDSLSKCGVAVKINALPVQALYAPGPDGSIFGRKFDLTLLSWQGSVDLGCYLYHREQVPTQDNQWIGTNVAGFKDEGYDAACVTAELALPNELSTTLRTIETSFIAAMPSVPLFAPPKVTIIPSDLCEEQTRSSDYDFFTGLESITGDKNCP